MTEELVRLVRRYANEINNGRSLVDIVDHMRGEVVELDEEIRKLALGEESGVDGVVGETIDIATCGLDFLVVHSPTITDAYWASRIDAVVEAVIERRKRFEGHHAGDFAAIREWTEMLAHYSRGNEVEVDLGPQAAINAVAYCVLMIRSDAQEMADDEILALATTKLEKWKAHYSGSIHRDRRGSSK